MMYEKMMEQDTNVVERSTDQNNSCHERSGPSVNQPNGVHAERPPIANGIPWLSAPNTSPTSFGMLQQSLPSPQLFQSMPKNRYRSDQSQLFLPRLMEHQANRRSRHFVPSNRKDEYYWVKRQKNNEAARKSREKRRINDIMLEKKVLQLIQENLQLKKDLLAVKVKYNEIDAAQLQEIKRQLEEPVPHLFSHLKGESVSMEDCVNGKMNTFLRDILISNKEERIQFSTEKVTKRFSLSKGEIEDKLSCIPQGTMASMIVKSEVNDPLKTSPFPDPTADLPHHHLPRSCNNLLPGSHRVEDRNIALALKITMAGQTNNAANSSDRIPDGQNEAKKISHSMIMALQSELQNSRTLPNGFGYNGTEHYSSLPRTVPCNAERKIGGERNSLYQGDNLGSMSSRNQEEAAITLSNLWQRWNERCKTSSDFSYQGGQVGGYSLGPSNSCGPSEPAPSCSKSNSDPRTPESESNSESSASGDSYTHPFPDNPDGESDSPKTSPDNRSSNDSSGSESGSSFSSFLNSAQDDSSELTSEKSHRLPYKLRFKLAASSSGY